MSAASPAEKAHNRKDTAEHFNVVQLRDRRENPRTIVGAEWQIKVLHDIWFAQKEAPSCSPGQMVPLSSYFFSIAVLAALLLLL